MMVEIRKKTYVAIIAMLAVFVASCVQFHHHDCFGRVYSALVEDHSHTGDDDCDSHPHHAHDCGGCGLSLTAARTVDNHTDVLPASVTHSPFNALIAYAPDICRTDDCVIDLKPEHSLFHPYIPPFYIPDFRGPPAIIFV